MVLHDRIYYGDLYEKLTTILIKNQKINILVSGHEAFFAIFIRSLTIEVVAKAQPASQYYGLFYDRIIVR